MSNIPEPKFKKGVEVLYEINYEILIYEVRPSFSIII